MPLNPGSPKMAPHTKGAHLLPAPIASSIPSYCTTGPAPSPSGHLSTGLFQAPDGPSLGTAGRSPRWTNHPGALQHSPGLSLFTEPGVSSACSWLCRPERGENSKGLTRKTLTDPFTDSCYPSPLFLPYPHQAATCENWSCQNWY